MKRPAVFFSSTCYDLGQVRADLRLFVESLGFEPVLSEFDTFPVDPSLGTLDNCLKAVANKADILVLIVGGRYGSVSDQGKSITNLEFLTARSVGIPVYAFVARRILEILPVWKQNPAGDFSGIVDSTKLFEFVTTLRDTKEAWVFPFDSAQDIIATLRNQLAYLFMESLSLRRKAASNLLSGELGKLSGTSFRIVVERPPAWEYLLFGSVLDDELKIAADLRRDWKFGIAGGSGRYVTGMEFLRWTNEKIQEFLRNLYNLKKLLEEVWPAASGPHGESGDAEAIVYVARRVVAAYGGILEWKLDVERTAVPSNMKKLKSLTASLCDATVEDCERLFADMKSAMVRAEEMTRRGISEPIMISLKLTVPDTAEYEEELARINLLEDRSP